VKLDRGTIRNRDQAGVNAPSYRLYVRL